MLVGSLLTMIGTVLLEFSLRQAELQEFMTTQAEVHADAAIALESLLKELRHGTRAAAASPPNVTIPASPGNTQLLFFLPTDADGNGVIVDIAGNMEWASGNPILYQYDAATLRLLRLEGAATRVLANNVTAATFEDQAINGALRADEVRVRLTLQRTTRRGRVLEADVTAIVQLRN
jgi:hypothetical protein